MPTKTDPRKAVSTKSRSIIWGKSAGRCHFPGCNKSLIGDLIAGIEDANFGFIAHIVSDKVGGPRYDEKRGLALRDDPANLMLLCYEHHKLVDEEEVEDYPEQRLLEIKASHEARISTVSAIAPDRASHVLRYGSKIGLHESILSFASVRQALIPHRYPAEGTSIGIEILGSASTDAEEAFWSTEPDNLRKHFATRVRDRIASREITHLSVFALAPIPLLMLFGTLLGDITQIDVFQPHREPSGWSWAENGPRLKLQVDEPEKISGVVALKLGISADIDSSRIRAVLGEETSIWSVSAMDPHNDIMRYRDDLAEFRKISRRLMNDIKARHGQEAVLHVFPAMPVSMAVEFGRVRMPKADLSLKVYDEVKGRGFIHRLDIT